MNFRGDKLKEYLKLKLLNLVSTYRDRDEEYVYSQKEFSFYAGVSRETVRKYQAELDVVLRSLIVQKWTFDKDAKYRNLQNKVMRLQFEVTKFESMYTAMREQYIDILEALLSNSIDTRHLLVRSAGALKVERLYKECVLCGSVVGKN